MSDTSRLSTIAVDAGRGSDVRLAEPSALAALRGQLGIVAALLAATAVAWWATIDRMAGMDAGPGTDLGALGWFTGLWAVMMAAMMLPSFAPTVAVQATLARRDLVRVGLFAGGYLLVWSAAGVVAYGLFALGKSVSGSALAWHNDGRWVAAGVLLLAALYQLTPYKRAFLQRCRSPLHSLGATWCDSRSGAFVMGLRSGGWCLGCSWALMAALFALGVMSVIWMVMIAGLVALEKVGPWGRPAKLATAAVLIALAGSMLAFPHELPGFVVPGSSGAMHAMKAMGTTG